MAYGLDARRCLRNDDPAVLRATTTVGSSVAVKTCRSAATSSASPGSSRIRRLPRLAAARHP